MRIIIVGSGSKGNAVLLESGGTVIQIDMGLTLKRIKEALSDNNLKPSAIKALFLTHDHADHISGVPLYHGKVPLYAGEGTIDCLTHALKPFETIEIGSFKITPFNVSHDAVNPMGFLFDDGKSKLGYVTDTGLLEDDVLNLLKDCDYYYFESNHDLKMLYDSSRPKFLKDRIHSKHGHLSNVDSAIYLSSLIGPRTKEIYLAHLSEECNCEEVALKSQYLTYERYGVDLSNVKIICAKQYETVVGGDK